MKTIFGTPILRSDPTNFVDRFFVIDAIRGIVPDGLMLEDLSRDKFGTVDPETGDWVWVNRFDFPYLDDEYLLHLYQVIRKE